MPEWKVLSGREVCRILEEHGFVLARQHGSHMVMQRKGTHGTTTVRVGGRVLHGNVLGSVRPEPVDGPVTLEPWTAACSSFDRLRTNGGDRRNDVKIEPGQGARKTLTPTPTVPVPTIVSLRLVHYGQSCASRASPRSSFRSVPAVRGGIECMATYAASAGCVDCVTESRQGSVAVSARQRIRGRLCGTNIRTA